MIEEGTTITRILDKLENADLIRRERGRPDRRVVLCYVTEKGARLLAQLDPKVDAADEEAVAGLGAEELQALVALLDRVRAANARRGAARSAGQK
jgi:DNA-binding MarR family transcriptional regulator